MFLIVFKILITKINKLYIENYCNTKVLYDRSVDADAILSHVLANKKTLNMVMLKYLLFLVDDVNIRKRLEPFLEVQLNSSLAAWETKWFLQL